MSIDRAMRKAEAANAEKHRDPPMSAAERRYLSNIRTVTAYAAELVLLDNFEHKWGNDARFQFLTRNIDAMARAGYRPDPDEVDALAERWRRHIKKKENANAAVE